MDDAQLAKNQDVQQQQLQNIQQPPNYPIDGQHNIQQPPTNEYPPNQPIDGQHNIQQPSNQPIADQQNININGYNQQVPAYPQQPQYSIPINQAGPPYLQHLSSHNVAMQTKSTLDTSQNEQQLVQQQLVLLKQQSEMQSQIIELKEKNLQEREEQLRKQQQGQNRIVPFDQIIEEIERRQEQDRMYQLQQPHGVHMDRQLIVKNCNTYVRFFKSYYSGIALFLYIFAIFYSILAQDPVCFLIFYGVQLLDFVFNKFTRVILGDYLTPSDIKQMVIRLKNLPVLTTVVFKGTHDTTDYNGQKSQTRHTLTTHYTISKNAYLDKTNVDIIDEALEEGDPVLVKFEILVYTQDGEFYHKTKKIQESFRQFIYMNNCYYNNDLDSYNQIETLPQFAIVTKDTKEGEKIKKFYFWIPYLIFSLFGFSWIYRYYFCCRQVGYQMNIRRMLLDDL